MCPWTCNSFGYSISICPFNYPPKSQFSPFVLLGVLYYGNLPGFFHQSFFHLSFFLSFFFAVGPMNTHHSFIILHSNLMTNWLENCIASASTGYEPKLFVYKKKKTQELLQFVFWVIVWCIPLPLQVCVVKREESLQRHLMQFFIFFCV